MKILRTVSLVVLTALATLGLRSALGVPVSGDGVAKHPTQVKTSFSNISTSATWVDPWTTVTSRKVAVPAGTKAIIDVRMTAAAQCFSAGTGHCWVRVKIGGVVVENDGSLFGIASSSQTDPTRTIALERASHVLKPGSYTVVVQIRSDGSAYTQAEVDYWHLTVERIIV
jgi:hypothetical protein